MGAWKTETMVRGSRNGNSTDNVPSLTAFVSPDSSFSSNSSLCEKRPTAQSPPRLRRSTLDLSHLKSSGILRSLQHETSDVVEDKQAEKKKTRAVSQESTVDCFVNESIFHYVSVLQTLALVEASLRLFLGEAQHHVGNVLGFLLNSIILNNSRASGEILAGSDSWTNNNDYYTEDDDVPTDPPFSPARVTAAPILDPKDEWGHFADFQEEPIDETFLVKPRFPALSSLTTLDEQEDCEGEDEAFSF